MAPKGMKRPAASTAGAPAKVQKTIAGFEKKCDAIIEALDHAEDIPESTRKMLAVGVRQSIALPKDQRHTFQEQMIGWVQEALSSVEAAMKKAIEAAEAEAASKTTQKDTCQSAQDAAKAAFDAKCEAVLAKKTALSDVEKQLAEASAEVKAAEEAQAEGDKLIVVVAETKSRLEVVTANFTKLKGGGVPPEEQKELLQSASKMGAEMKLDQSMLTSLPSALAKEIEVRGEFDNMVINSFESELQKQADSLTEELANAEPAKNERAAKVEAAKATVETLKNATETSKQELDAANADKDAAQIASKEAISATKQSASELKTATSNLNEAKKCLTQLEKAALADFKELNEWDGTPKVSQYKTIGGVRYERDLLDMAGEDKITMEKAGALFEKAMDGNVVTPTEKRTLRYILKNKGFEDEAKNFLETKMGSSWYQTIDGVEYERTLLTIAADESSAGPFGMEAAEKLWNSAQDRNVVTACEKRTLQYILDKNEFATDAKTWLEEQVASVEEEVE